MATYTKTNWATGELITAEKMNKIENQLELVTPGATNVAQDYTSGSYKVGDYRIYNGQLYRCTTTGAGTPPSGWVATNVMAEAGSGVGDSIAQEYSTSSSKTYAVGDYVVFERKLYRCTAETTGETWDSTKWTTSILANDVADLKSAVKDRTLFKDTAFADSLFPLRSGVAINSAGRYSNETNSVAGLASVNCIFVYAGTKITANEGYKFSWSLWDVPITANVNVSHQIGMGQNVAAGTTVMIPVDGYLGFSCTKADGSALPSGKTVYEFANDAVTVELYIRTTKAEVETLIPMNNWVTQNNNPVSALRQSYIMSKNVCKNTDYTSGYYIKPDGSLVQSNSFKVSDYFMVEPNTQYYLANSSSTIVFYDYNKNYICGVDKSASTTVVTSPANACFARYSTNGTVSTWNVSKGTAEIDTPYFEPYIDLSGVANSPFYKGKFAISKPDVHQWYECECLKEDVNAFDFSLGSDTAYTGTQYADIISLLDDLVSAAETGYITKTAIGTGSGTDEQGNDYTLYEYAFVPKAYSMSQATQKHPKILLDSAIHGFEKNSTFAIFALLYDVVHNWQKNDFLATLRNFVEIRWVPVSDPYGFDHNIRNNGNDVNLNRNFPADGWTPGEGINYGGEEPLDQPEAAALATWLQANPDMLFYLNLHTNGHYASSGYSDANCCMPYTNIGDDYYNYLFDAIRRHIERQTAELPKEFNVLTPSYSQFIGKLQAAPTSTSGYIDQYVCAYLRSALAMTVEGCNQLSINGETVMAISSGTVKMVAEMYGNLIKEIFYELLQ